jgi:hypothetical protein
MHAVLDDVIREKLDLRSRVAHVGDMRKVSPLLEVFDRTTLIPGEAPMLCVPELGAVIDCMFAVRENPNDRRAKIQLTLLQRQGNACCPACGDDVDLAGFRRTRTNYAVRDEWACAGCHQRFLLAEENVC